MTLPFAIIAVLTIAAAVAAMSLRNLVHCALAVVVALAGLAMLYLQLNAQFVGFAQILVYVGGVMVLFLFVIMLVNVGAEEEGRAAIFNRPAQVTAALVFLGLLAGVLVIYAMPRGYQAMQKRAEAALQQGSAKRAAAESKDTARPAQPFDQRDGARGHEFVYHASLPLKLRASSCFRDHRSVMLARIEAGGRCR
jgi:NADH-quinone oxidoreductase subunit J